MADVTFRIPSQYRVNVNNFEAVETAPDVWYVKVCALIDGSGRGNIDAVLLFQGAGQYPVFVREVWRCLSDEQSNGPLTLQRDGMLTVAAKKTTENKIRLYYLVRP